jgi:hypothetical protein
MLWRTPVKQLLCLPALSVILLQGVLRAAGHVTIDRLEVTDN